MNQSDDVKPYMREELELVAAEWAQADGIDAKHPAVVRVLATARAGLKDRELIRRAQDALCGRIGGHLGGTCGCWNHTPDGAASSNVRRQAGLAILDLLVE